LSKQTSTDNTGICLSNILVLVGNVLLVAKKCLSNYFVKINITWFGATRKVVRVSVRKLPSGAMSAVDDL